jgi:hypothetical protein
VTCDGCGQPLLVFEGFEDLTTCPDCAIAWERAEIPDQIKAVEWLEVMEWLDFCGIEISGGERRLTLAGRLEAWRRHQIALETA